MMLLPLWGLLQLVTVTMQQDMIYLTQFSGEFTSPGYPDTPTGWTQWNITVKEDCRILLHFLDFELYESHFCIPDSFALYDGAFESELELDKFCWSSYNKLNPSTYISSGHIFLLNLRTHCCYPRKGFKANYSSIPKESKSTAAPNVKTTKLTTTPTPKRTSITEKVPDVTYLTTPTDILSSTTSTISLSTKPSVAIASKNPATIPGIIAAIVIALIAVILSLAMAIWKIKRCKCEDGVALDSSQLCPSQPTFSIAGYEDVQQENGSLNPTHHENQIEAPTNRALQQSSAIHQVTFPRNGNKDISNGMYETIDDDVYSYADPNEHQLYI